MGLALIFSIYNLPRISPSFKWAYKKATEAVLASKLLKIFKYSRNKQIVIYHKLSELNGSKIIKIPWSYFFINCYFSFMKYTNTSYPPFYSKYYKVNKDTILIKGFLNDSEIRTFMYLSFVLIYLMRKLLIK